jgi:vacuolar-type H+-ATPase subunit E/Vma4
MKYYSEKLDRMFETEADLVKEETKAAEAEAKKTKASKQKKEDATKVEIAFKARNAAKRTYNETVLALKKKYNEDLLNLKTAFETAVQAAAEALQNAETNYDTELKAFIKKHPEGYHMTLKDGDNVVTISNTQDTDIINELLSPKSFWDEWMKIFRF